MKTPGIIIKYVFLLLPILTYSQEREIIDTVKTEFVYEYMFQQDSMSESSIKSQLMVLQLGNRFSRFTGENIPAQDSIFEANKNTDTQHIINQLLPLMTSQPGNILADYSIYKSFLEKGSIEMTSVLSPDNYYRVVQKIRYQWSIINSADTIILGYPCKKARTHFAGRDYTAWFTPEIPVSDGPYKFYGLPGLIVLIEDSQKQHRFELLSTRKPKYLKPIYYQHKSYITITPQQYIKVIEQVNNHRYEKFSNMSEFSEENLGQVLRRTKMRNNFIERY
ncbi:GLPGLI family protein [Thermophagus xiamenensis]|jgi:GLPGLI family protein|uniref:GLPGLI family protein n=1 Tax=Thermophagus xiamenensis TaxID=385682 RepID=A0A1I1VP96_9BACT|nr:GLPGLI family protein [Thermophagus xiamenensis]SFD82320.1 GLPGLI family protein [Thermophagus xiamenensis]